jgi:D-alanine-D-alanine ligase
MTNPTKKDLFGKVAVLMGGNSGEREISLRSGSAVLKALLASGVDSHGVDVGSDVFTLLHEHKFDRVFIALHGCGGEDGSIQGGLEIINMPYTGSGVMSSSICMNKIMTKKLWLAENISSPKFISIQSTTSFQDVADLLGTPFILKPSLEGSSLGISKIENESQYNQAVSQSHKFKGVLLAEQWVSGREYTVAILDGQALPVIRLETPRGFYDFEAKYQAKDTQYLIPCGLNIEDEKEIQEQALQAFNATGATGWGRVDVMIDDANKYWFLEVNTVPGMTDHSLVPMAAKHVGISFEELVVKILETSL